jgi:hypothetical protein
MRATLALYDAVKLRLERQNESPARWNGLTSTRFGPVALTFSAAAWGLFRPLHPILGYGQAVRQISAIGPSFRCQPRRNFRPTGGG